MGKSVGTRAQEPLRDIEVSVGIDASKTGKKTGGVGHGLRKNHAPIKWLAVGLIALGILSLLLYSIQSGALGFLHPENSTSTTTLPESQTTTPAIFPSTTVSTTSTIIASTSSANSPAETSSFTTTPPISTAGTSTPSSTTFPPSRNNVGFENFGQHEDEELDGSGEGDYEELGGSGQGEA